MTDIDKAKEYLKSRLNAEQSMSRNLSALLIIFAQQLLAIYKRYGVKPDSMLIQFHPDLKREIDNLVRRLKDELYEDCELLAIQADKEKKDHIIFLINMAIYGQTLKGRISYWVDRFLEDIKKQISEGKESFGRIPMNVGDAYGLDRLLRQTISNAFTEIDKERAEEQGAKYFISHVASSRPCNHCSSVDGVKQPMSAYPSWGSYHPNCCCYFTFLDK